jgi:hypothetical protein
MPRKLKTILLQGFDAQGEPEIRRMNDGSLNVVFNFMPPSDAQDGKPAARYDHFDKQMAAAIGLPVVWEDREVFVVQNPNEETLKKLTAFIEGYKAGKHLRYIKITRTPPGAGAPEEVRAKWIGLILPLSPVSYPQPKSFKLRVSKPTCPPEMIGYCVFVDAAIAVLEQAHPEAAAWWRENAPELFEGSRTWIYDAASCEEVRLAR